MRPGTLVRGPLHVPLGELAASTLAVEAHHEAVVVDLVDRAARFSAVGTRTDRHGYVAIDGDGPIGGVVGARLVPRRGVLVLSLAEPRFDDGIAAANGLVVGLVAVLAVLAEQGRDPVPLIGQPCLDVIVEPALDLLVRHRRARRRTLPDAVRGTSETNSNR